jgi:hypothetical protein
VAGMVVNDFLRDYIRFFDGFGIEKLFRKGRLASISMIRNEALAFAWARASQQKHRGHEAG